jgi:hypothetical protein
MAGTGLVAALVALASLGMLAGCSDDESSTELNTAGPPMVQQVFAAEKVFNTSGQPAGRFGLAFGDHPDVPTPDEDAARGDDRQVINATANRGDSRFRVVLDELLVGNYIEEIQCADGSFSRVPVGTDPDDIARCAGPDLSSCEAVCIGPGGPIGITDQNEDGAVDPGGLRMIDYGGGELAVSLVCDDQSIPLLGQVGEDAKRSFYNPSGNQQIPSDTGVDGLGPALVLVTQSGLRTSANCTIRFRAEVVDKDGNRVCAPPGGDVDQDCAGNGNTEAIQFQVEPMAVGALDIGDNDDDGIIDPETGTDQTILLEFVTDVDPETIGAITLATGGAEVPIEAAIGAAADTVVVTVTGGYQPDSEYTVTVGTGLTDLFGAGPPDPITFSFTTSAEKAP